MAAPHVAGVAALMFARNPGLTPDDLEARLKQSARLPRHLHPVRQRHRGRQRGRHPGRADRGKLLRDRGEQHDRHRQSGLAQRHQRDRQHRFEQRYRLLQGAAA
ncbi:S8 family serine peptidase [Massilia sp. B-10]|nr:S8 family serine peptidase [Massilia sp. B-10]